MQRSKAMANLDLKLRTSQPGSPTTRYPSVGLAQAETDVRRRYPKIADLDLKLHTPQLGSPTARYPSAGLAQAEADFRRRYPEYAHTGKLDELRATEYARLDRQGHVYLDYTGGSLYAESQLRDHFTLLNQRVFGNPHSKNLTSMAMTELV